MATLKRRIVYMSDEEWTTLKAKSEERGFTISEYVRRVLSVHEPVTSTWAAVKARKTGGEVRLKGRDPEDGIGRSLTQAQRDAILRKVQT
jgi:hypothetical protein